MFVHYIHRYRNCVFICDADEPCRALLDVFIIHLAIIMFMLIILGECS